MKSETVPLGRVTRWLSGGTPSRAVESYWSGDIPWISASTLKDAEISESDQHLTSEAVAVGSKMAPIGSTLFLVRGSALYKEIRAGLVVAPVCFNQDVKALIPSSDVEPKFLTYSLLGRSEDLLKLVSTAGNSAGVLDTRLVQSFDIFLPDRAEQRAIVEALSDADGLLRASEALIAKKLAIKQSAMQQLLTGKTRVPGYRNQWEKKKIRDIAMPSGERNTLSDDLPVLACSKHFGFVDSLGYFKNRVFSKNLSSYRLIHRGDIAYPANHVEEGSIGLQDLYDVALVSPIYVAFTPVPGVNSYFLHRLLKLDSYRQIFATATNSSVDRRGSLRWRQFSDVTVAIPQKDEQDAIAAVLAEMEAEIAVLENRRQKTRAIKEGMMQQLLSGRVRLVKPSLAAAGA